MKLRTILESPDQISRNKYTGKLTYVDDDAIPFGYKKTGPFYIGKPGTTHTSIPIYLTCGRIWSNSKVIAFWVINEPIVTIIKLINKALSDAGYKIKVDDSWYINVSSDTIRTRMKLPYRPSPELVEKTGILKLLSDVIKDNPEGKGDDYTSEWKQVYNL